MSTLAPRRLRRRSVAGAVALAAALACAACSHEGAGVNAVTASSAPVADSITVGLWHLDEAGGVACADAGPFHLQGTAGLDTHTDFGRFGNARTFTGSIESWVFVPYAPSMNTPRVAVEAWIDPAGYGTYEDTPIAGRWTEYPNEQSWLFSLVGLQRDSRLTNVQAPGFHESLVDQAPPRRLMFAFQPVEPGPAGVYFSATEIPLQRWTHVAVTHDGSVVKFWINGQLDAQYATRTTIREGLAPLLVGNYFDTRKLSDFGGDLRVGPRVTHPPVYAFLGAIDELRVSSQARDSFGLAR